MAALLGDLPSSIDKWGAYAVSVCRAGVAEPHAPRAE